MPNLQIEQTPIHALKACDRNARTHSKRQIRQLSASITRFGFCNPVIVDDDLKILAGHGRVKAAELLGFTCVPTIKLSHLSDAEKRAYIIADNRLAEKAGWDRDLLALELQGLIDIGFDVELTGFEMPEIDLLLDEALEAGGLSPAADDNLPAGRDGPPITGLGDLWTLGIHRVFCGDARSAASYERVLNGQKADLVFTDPPYNVRIDGHVSGLGRVRHAEFAMASGEMTETQFTDFLRASLGLAVKASREGALHYVFMDWRHLHELQSVGRELYDSLLNLCVWNKDNGGMGSLYRSKHELVTVFKVGSAPHVNNVELGRHGRNRTNVWDYAGVNTFRTERRDELAMHPTVKPVALVTDAIRDASCRSDLVLDPFAGSGTTIIAAEKTGRRARALEIDPHYVDVIIERWQAYTGKHARLDTTTASFEEVAEQRQTEAKTIAAPTHTPISDRETEA
ncbi:MAG: site-specific DNA-methyltransferase [Candidatus Binatia bacterium]